MVSRVKFTSTEENYFYYEISGINEEKGFFEQEMKLYKIIIEAMR